MEAGGLLPASVRALSGGDAEDAPEEFIPQSRAQQLRLGVRQAHQKLELSDHGTLFEKQKPWSTNCYNLEKSFLLHSVGEKSIHR